MNLFKRFSKQKPKELAKEKVTLPLFKVRTGSDNFIAINIQKTDTLIHIPKEAYGVVLNAQLNYPSIMIPVSEVLEIHEIGIQEFEV